MYLYYETHRDGLGTVVLTEMRISSRGDGQLYIDFRDPTEKILFELCKTILKYPPVAQRSYEESTKVWSFFGDWGTQVIERLKDVTKPLGEIQLIAVEELSTQALNNRIDLTGKRKRYKPEDFFYNHGQPVAQRQMSKETLCERLKSLMGETLDKSAYRRAAMRFHPDKNNEDGTKMSELNSLWSVYNA